MIATVSRLAPNRGHELLLAGFRLLLARLPEARLLLVGKGEARARLEALVHELGLGERVIFTGYRDRDLPAVLGAADCFALMAAGSDDSCRAALEAMAAGRAVVARRVGALPETVAHGVTGMADRGGAPGERGRGPRARPGRSPGGARHGPGGTRPGGGGIQPGARRGHRRRGLSQPGVRILQLVSASVRIPQLVSPP